ncbi:putative RNA-binding protein [Serendipita vermifera]|nr:putative RNA-binding protein [Serendipita vermifera]
MAAAPPAPPQAHAGAQTGQPRQPGMLAQMAATAGSVAVGSTIGHGISSMLFGGRSEAQAPPAHAQTDASRTCEPQAKVESRIIVKNLPTYITEPRLREHFLAKSQPGDITDVKIVHKKDGTTRRIAFIGYKTDEQAHSAKEYFDKTYFDISKLKVDIVTGIKDAPIRPHNGKRARDADELETDRRKKKNKPITQLEQDLSSEQGTKSQQKKGAVDFEEFQKVMGTKRNARPAWSGDIDEVPQPQETKQSSSLVDKKQRHRKEGELDQNDEDVDMANGEDDVEEVSDMEWLKRKMQKQVEISVDKDFERSDEEMGTSVEKTESPEATKQSHGTKDAILSNGRLFVRNLVFSCTEDELRDHFQQYGDVKEVHIPLDASSSSKGFAYVRFTEPSDAVNAFDALDGSSFQGRLLHILPAVDRHAKPLEPVGGEKRAKGLKEVRAQNRKDNSGKNFNWAVLYMNVNRLGIPKADILNPDSSQSGTSPAVKLALAETHIIAETKKYFEEHNVDLSLFSRPRHPRDRTTILVKNIPYGTSASALSDLFSPYGRVRRILLPPAGTIAIVQYEDGQEKEAQEAWGRLAYKRLKDSILYLEWAPLGIFDGSSRDKQTSQKSPQSKEDEKTDENNLEEEDLPLGATLHIGNLSFATTSARLSSLFRHMSSFAFAKVATKPDPNKPGETLSQGYGFVGFRDANEAKKVLKGLGLEGTGLVLDGHILKVSLANRGKDEVERGGSGIAVKGGKDKGTKLIVKNLAFEVSKKELRELFSAHGQIKSVRLPNRADRRSRGFAFIDFATHKEAENAMEQLRHTHLLGRHLVLEWAEKEKDLEEMRSKTMREYGEGAGRADLGRKEKLRLGKGEASDGDE